MALTAMALFSPASGRQATPGRTDRARARPAMLKSVAEYDLGQNRDLRGVAILDFHARFGFVDSIEETGIK